MIAKNITYVGIPLILMCDGNCKKAWGNGRPHIYLDDVASKVYGIGFPDLYHPDPDRNGIDEDDWVWLADHELGDAPDDNGMVEGGHSKPIVNADRLNKWCVRQCERSVMVEEDQDFELPNLDRRLYNIIPHIREKD
jgi:hypothetical protein